MLMMVLLVLVEDESSDVPNTVWSYRPCRSTVFTANTRFHVQTWSARVPGVINSHAISIMDRPFPCCMLSSHPSGKTQRHSKLVPINVHGILAHVREPIIIEV